MSETNHWDYWRPAEGQHKLHPNELQIGILSPTDEVLLVVAVIPPLETRDGTDQPEALATVMLDALAERSWSDRDGLTAWLFAHGHPLAPDDWPPRFDPMTGKHDSRYDG